MLIPPEVVRDRAAFRYLTCGFPAAEDYINDSHLTDDQKAAVWLYVWSLQSRSDQLQMAEGHLRDVTVPAG